MEDQLERHIIEQWETFYQCANEKADRTLELLKALPTETGEDNHVSADDILSDFVRRLGFTEIAEAYESIGKWYA
jgi:hypothetical protein